jgi:hypothetical protein
MAERTADFTKVGARYNFDLSGRPALWLYEAVLPLPAAFIAMPNSYQAELIKPEPAISLQHQIYPRMPESGRFNA